MNKREQIAAMLLDRDEGGDSSEWAEEFIAKCKDQLHQGDCHLADRRAPFTCSRCVCDRALADADRIIGVILSN